MINKEFSAQYLGEMICRKDEVHYPFIKNKGHKENYLKSTEDRIRVGNYSFRRLVRKSIRNFVAYRTKKLGDELVLRKITEILKKSYRLKMGDRAELVKQTRMLLKDSVPKNVLRLDITSFYESIDTDILFQKIVKDKKVGFLNLNILKLFLDSLKRDKVKGLPRGLGISAILSEIYLEGIDRNIQKIPGVYYYGRYVDDMVVFTVGNIKELMAHVQLLLPLGMSLNEKKTRSYKVSCKCKPMCLHKPNLCPCNPKCKCKINDNKLNMELLGYSLKFNKSLGKSVNKPQVVLTDYSNKKISRMKTRIILSILSHVKNPNYSLLESRMRFLTENRRMKNLSVRGKLKTGIYYNHPLLTEVDGLHEIELFLRQILYGSSPLNAQLLTLLNPGQVANLRKLSFLSGYHARRMRKITTGELKHIKKCWNHNG